MGFHTLSIGVTGLMTQKIGLDTTGHNIANADTPGFARQRLTTEANNPTIFTWGAEANGVNVKKLAHMQSNFLESLVRDAKATKDYLEDMQDAYENLEVVFNELSENDISTAMDDLWNALNNLANNVEDISTRRTVADAAQTLSDMFQNIENKIREYRMNQNEAIVDTVGDVSSYLKQIAELNQEILAAEGGGATGVVASDLRDRRTQILKELSGLVDITAREEDDGSMVVSLKNRTLVYKGRYEQMTTVQELSDDLLIDRVVYALDEGDTILDDGKLAAMVDIRDEVLLGFKQDIDRLAGTWVWEFNRLHSQGVGLHGYSELRGGVSVVDPTRTLDELTYDFVPLEGTYEVENGNLEVVVYDTQSGREYRANIEIDLDNEDADADTILYDPVLATQPDNSLVKKLQDVFDSIQPSAFEVELDLSNKLTITAQTDDLVFGFGRDTSGVLAALGLNTFFTGYDASSINVNSLIVDQPDKLAGAQKFVVGDQQNVMALLGLRETAVLSSETATMDEYYQSVVGRLGIEGSRTNSLLETQEDILLRMENQREDLSGVNLDEELTKMIMYQRSFQSAARFISTADTMYETLINM